MCVHEPKWYMSEIWQLHTANVLWLIEQTMNLLTIWHLICIYNNFIYTCVCIVSLYRFYSRNQIILFPFFFIWIFFALFLLHFDRSITLLYAKNIIEWYSYSTSIARLYVYIISWHLRSERKLVYHHRFKN